MAKVKENISQDLVKQLSDGQNETSNIIFQLGEISLRIRELSTESQRLQEVKKELEEKFDVLALKLDNIVSDLQKKYPNAEIDLNEGTVTYES